MFLNQNLLAAKSDAGRNAKQELKSKMHILIVNSSSFQMTLSNSLCKHFYIRSKLKGKRCLKCLLYLTVSPFHLDYVYEGVNSCWCSCLHIVLCCAYTRNKHDTINEPLSIRRLLLCFQYSFFFFLVM